MSSAGGAAPLFSAAAVVIAAEHDARRLSWDATLGVASRALDAQVGRTEGKVGTPQNVG
jgi:hypothetical protein